MGLSACQFSSWSSTWLAGEQKNKIKLKAKEQTKMMTPSRWRRVPTILQSSMPAYWSAPLRTEPSSCRTSSQPWDQTVELWSRVRWRIWWSATETSLSYFWKICGGSNASVVVAAKQRHISAETPQTSWQWRSEEDAGASSRGWKIDAGSSAVWIKVGGRREDVGFSRRAALPCCPPRSALSQRSQSTGRWWWRPGGYQYQNRWHPGSRPSLTDHRYTGRQRQQQ